MVFTRLLEPPCAATFPNKRMAFSSSQTEGRILSLKESSLSRLLIDLSNGISNSSSFSYSQNKVNSKVERQSSAAYLGAEKVNCSACLISSYIRGNSSARKSKFDAIYLFKRWFGLKVTNI